VVLKADFRRREYSLPGLSAQDFDAFDLGFGYNF